LAAILFKTLGDLSFLFQDMQFINIQKGGPVSNHPGFSGNSTAFAFSVFLLPCEWRAQGRARMTLFLLFAE
jgi:hypothetical protein